MCGLESMAEATSPPTLSLPPSPLRSVGVRAASDLPPHAQTGPHPAPLPLGHHLSDSPAVACFLQVECRHGRILMEGDTSDQWLLYVQPARDLHEQNMEAFRGPTGRLHFRCLRRVARGEQLLAWYSEELAREIGIPILGPENIRENLQYACTQCGESFLYPNTLKAHIFFRCKQSRMDLFKRLFGCHSLLPSTSAHALNFCLPGANLQMSPPDLSIGWHSRGHVASMDTDQNRLPEGEQESRTENSRETSTSAGSSGISAFRPLAKTSTGDRHRSKSLRAVEGPMKSEFHVPVCKSDPCGSPNGLSVHSSRKTEHSLMETCSQNYPSDRCRDLSAMSGPSAITGSSPRSLGNGRRPEAMETSPKMAGESSRSERVQPDTTTEDPGALNLSLRNASPRRPSPPSSLLRGQGQGHDVGPAHSLAQPIQIFNHIHPPAMPMGLEHPAWGLYYPYWPRVAEHPGYCCGRLPAPPPPCPRGRAPFLPPVNLLTSESSQVPSQPVRHQPFSDDPNGEMGGMLSPGKVPFPFPLPSEKEGEPLDLLPRSLFASKSKKGHLCVYCGKLYSRKYGLKIHLRTHTGYKPLKCKVCHRPFGDPSNLNKHVRLHAEGDTPYRCEYCGKVLVRRRDLERHVRSRHPMEEKKSDEVFGKDPSVTSSLESDSSASETEGEIVVT